MSLFESLGKTRYALYFLLVVAIAALPIGLALDPKGFTVNLLADAVTTVIGIWVAVFVVESILKRRSIDEWQSVSKLSTSAITQATRTTAFKYSQYIELTGFRRYLRQNDSSAVDSSILSEMLEAMRISNQPSKDSMLSLHSQCTVEFTRIRDVILPIVASAGHDISLLSSIQRFDSSVHVWDLAVARNHHIGVSGSHMYDCAVNTFEQLIELNHIAQGN